MRRNLKCSHDPRAAEASFEDGRVFRPLPKRCVDVVEQCARELPVLEEVSECAIEDAPGQPTNLIIEGDNYHALSPGEMIVAAAAVADIQ